MAHKNAYERKVVMGEADYYGLNSVGNRRAEIHRRRRLGGLVGAGRRGHGPPAAAFQPRLNRLRFWFTASRRAILATSANPALTTGSMLKLETGNITGS